MIFIVDAYVFKYKYTSMHRNFHCRGFDIIISFINRQKTIINSHTTSPRKPSALC